MWSWHYVPTYDILTNSVTVYNAIAAAYMKWVWDRLASRDFTLCIATFLMAPSSVWSRKTWTVTYVLFLWLCFWTSGGKLLLQSLS